VQVVFGSITANPMVLQGPASSYQTIITQGWYTAGMNNSMNIIGIQWAPSGGYWQATVLFGGTFISVGSIYVYFYYQ
jgi:hypothetical protein